MFSRILRMIFGGRENAEPNPQEIENLLDSLEPWIEKHRRNCWRPVVRNGGDCASSESQFGGIPWLPSGESWPKCGACEREMHHFLQLNLAMLPEGFKDYLGDGLLQMFYCTMSDCERDEWEPFNSGHLIRVSQFDSQSQSEPLSLQHDPFPTKRIIGWDPIADHPDSQDYELYGLRYSFKKYSTDTIQVECDEPQLRFSSVTLRDQTGKQIDFADSIGACHMRDKLGGWPHWVQASEWPECPHCQQRMEFLFQVDSKDNIPFMFGDLGTGHITYCRIHPGVFAFEWACG